MTDPTTLDLAHNRHVTIGDLMVTDWGLGDGTRRITLLSADGSAMWTLNLSDADRGFLHQALASEVKLPQRTWSERP